MESGVPFPPPKAENKGQYKLFNWRTSQSPQKLYPPDTMRSPNHSPVARVGQPITLPPPEDAPAKPPPPPQVAVTIVNRTSRDDIAVVTKLDGVGGGRGRFDGEGSTRDGGEKFSRVVTGIVRRSRRESSIRKAALGVRVSQVVLCLVSFSVMAADKTRGWAGDSFDRYIEYRYCLTVNILGFVYSGFQVYAQVHHMITEEQIIRHPIRPYFDFAMDQILAYLLISSSSSAATRNNDWISNWGNDDFTVMANGSISMSFLAFVAFAISSLISAYHLFSGNL